jgi:hypothetical protein
MTKTPRKKTEKRERSALERVPMRKLVASVKKDLKGRILKAVESGDLPRNWKNR